MGVWAALFFMCVLPDDLQNMPEDARGDGLTSGGGMNDRSTYRLGPAERPRPLFPQCLNVRLCIYLQSDRSLDLRWRYLHMNCSFPRALRVSLVVEVPLSQQHVPIHYVPKRSVPPTRACV